MAQLRVDVRLCIVATLQVSIGLPKWLIGQDTKTTVVLVYIGVLVIFVPILVFYWYELFC